MKAFGAREMNVARAAAVVADVLQVGVFPLFGEGFASPANVVLDCVLFGLLWWLIGFHVAFLPTFVVEEVPVLNLAPTWTAAVLIATRKGVPRIAAAPPPSLESGAPARAE